MATVRARPTRGPTPSFATMAGRPGGRYRGRMTQPDRLEAKDLAARRSDRPVFQGVSFRLESGGALRLAGRNGGGKTTLLRLIAGLGRAEAGSVLWNGHPIDADRESHAARTAWLGHADGLKSALSVRENLEAVLRIAERPRDRLEPALAALGLIRLADLPTGWLSSGQRRRAALARVVAMGADLWLLDEPTVGLDAASVAALEAAIVAHRTGGGMVIAATHTDFALGPDTASLDPALHPARAVG